MPTPLERVRALNDRPVAKARGHVLYWMVAARRPRHSFALERAVDLAQELDRPLVVLEPLRAGYRFACDRFHRFVIDGMADHAAFFGARGVAYHPYVEPAPGEGRGLLEALAADACAVVTDDWPCFFLPRMQAAAAARLDVRLEAVDGNGLMPIGRADKAFARAFDFRRFLHRELGEALERWPVADPTDEALRAGAVPDAVANRWPAASAALLAGEAEALAALPIDHAIGPTDLRGGFEAADRRVAEFVATQLDRYGERNHPDAEVTSELSPYLHFGQVSTHAVLKAIADREGWSPAELDPSAKGAREGFWGTSPPAEQLLDQLVTWRELGFNQCRNEPAYDRYASLPEWAKATLAKHARDPRPDGYEDLARLEAAETDDPLWNAAQRQLLESGRMHNYLRMLWGKKILGWAPRPELAAEWMITLNDRYALDGRDPNSYSGIFWCLGRYDRAWGPERPIFGTVRYMTSESTRRKLKLGAWLARWGEQRSLR